MENPVTAGATVIVATGNPYGLSTLIRHGDVVSHAVLFILLIMSLMSWYIILTKLWSQYRAGSRSSPRESLAMALLLTIGSTAPLVGLFGTVFGTLKALIAASVSGQPGFDKVAGPIGEALIMTAIGLSTAVPAVFGYNILMRRTNANIDSTREFTGDLKSGLIGSPRPD